MFIAPLFSAVDSYLVAKEVFSYDPREGTTPEAIETARRMVRNLAPRFNALHIPLEENKELAEICHKLWGLASRHARPWICY